MSREHITDADLQHLKSYDMLLAYCEKMLPSLRRHGKGARCACPYGTHSRPDHLELAERDGAGVAICRACNMGGSVIDVAAAVMGVGAREHFTDVARHVAEITGYALHVESMLPRGRKAAAYVKRQAEKIARQKRILSVLTVPAPPPETEYLPDADAELALASVSYANNRRDIMARHADAMRIPLDALMRHTDMELAARGLLGLAPDGRMLYVYTVQDDAERVRVVAVKLRGNGRTDERKMYIRRGAWQTGDLMRYGNGEPIRFMFAAGRPSALYGVDDLTGHYMAFLTEGESDKLALDYVLDYRREAHQTGIDAPDDYIPEEEIPVAIAKAGAGVFKPEWAARFAGMAVVITADNDDAGRKGAHGTAQILRDAGALDVYMWTPPEGYKDARAMVAACSPRDVYSNIINRMTMILQ